MAVQERISAAHNEAKIGSHLRVVIDRAEDGFYVGRTEYDSPEVDPEVLIIFFSSHCSDTGWITSRAEKLTHSCSSIRH